MEVAANIIMRSADRNAPDSSKLMVTLGERIMLLIPEYEATDAVIIR